MTAKDVIRLVIEDIDSEIKMQESYHAYAERKHLDKNTEKMHAMSTGKDYLTACEEYDFSMGYHAGMAAECEDRIKVLKRKREYYVSLDKRSTEEEE